MSIKVGPVFSIVRSYQFSCPSVLATCRLQNSTLWINLLTGSTLKHLNDFVRLSVLSFRKSDVEVDYSDSTWDDENWNESDRTDEFKEW